MKRIKLEQLRYACYRGCFPMSNEDGVVEFWGVKTRALMPIEGIRVSRSLARRIRKGGFEIVFDRAFRDVIEGCRQRPDTWINDEIVDLYFRAHLARWAHSCECWIGGELAGGVYGLQLGSCFSAESMFHRKPDASKIALWALVNRCREAGFQMFDVQIINPFTASLGAYEITNEEYVRRLQDGFSWRPEQFP